MRGTGAGLGDRNNRGVTSCILYLIYNDRGLAGLDFTLHAVCGVCRRDLTAMRRFRRTVCRYIRRVYVYKYIYIYAHMYTSIYLHLYITIGQTVIFSNVYLFDFFFFCRDKNVEIARSRAKYFDVFVLAHHSIVFTDTHYFIP